MRSGLAAVIVMIGASMPAYGQAPMADHHQHLFSPALAALISPAPPAAPVVPITAADLITLLDAAGIRRAAVLSTAYIFEQPTRKVDNATSRSGGQRLDQSTGRAARIAWSGSAASIR